MTYSAPGDAINGAVDPTLFMACGTYTGTGVSQNIACGFQPRTIISAANVTTSSRNGGYKNSSLASNNAIATGGGTTAGITITSTGFTVDAGNQFNYSGTVYYWTAWK